MPATIYVPSSRAEPTNNSTGHILTQSSATAINAFKSDSTLRTVDALVRQRAIYYPQDHIVSYPRSGIDFIDYNIQELDVFAWRAASRYAQHVPARKTSQEKPRVVALLGLSNLEYLITLLALTKLGHTVLLVSTRITVEAVESLINATSTATIITDKRHSNTAKQVQELVPSLQLLDIVDRAVFEYSIEAHGDTQLDAQLDAEIETQNIAFIIHSSGSTGHPKPIYQSHKSCLANYSVSMNMKSFITLPLFHNHGICNFFRALHSRKSIHLYNAELPLTQDYLLKIMQANNFEIFYGVPYALKLLSETQRGISVLQELKVVMYGGSACPDDLGNLLVENGVNLIGHYGATEVGQLMTSFRPEGDKEWNYVRESEKLSKFLRWVPRGPGLYECVVLDGWPSKVQSNQHDGSYATKDLFQPHPSIPRAWKYIARLDDTIVLVNGEKFNPVMMEGKIRSNKNVAEVVVFGAGRAHLGMLLIPAAALADRATEEILDTIWPVVELANQTADAFARISRNMIRVLPHDCSYPRTDKGSIIRQAFYKQFQQEIEEAYDLADTVSRELVQFSLPELQDFLRGLLQKTLHSPTTVEDDDDFFVLGLDSLQAIHMRSEILRTVDIGGNKLGQQVVFEQPSINRLSSFLLNLRIGRNTDEEPSIEQQMESLVTRYSTEILSISSRSSIVVTGATGSLGAHVVANWNNDLIPALHKCGLVFDEVEPKEWIKRLRASNPDPIANPPIKLTDFFASKYDKDSFNPSNMFATDVARSLSPALNKIPNLVDEHVAKFVSYLTEKAWKKSSSPAGVEKMAIIMIGPCGTGKSTIGKKVSQTLDVPFIEGDELHSRQAVEKMRSGVSLADDDRISWIDRINHRATGTLFDLAYDSVVISCSALKEVYRDQIRHYMTAHKVKVVFISLEADREVLARRLQERKGHYMSQHLVDSQIDLYEEPGSKEYDIVPVDAEKDEETVLEMVRWLLEDAVKLL
ncbi:putative NRPS-like protein biosynthetic cluster [Trichoderma virens]|nr:putative NRPS-like protein biosynthetic cluster [Trichoderma virens]